MARGAVDPGSLKARRESGNVVGPARRYRPLSARVPEKSQAAFPERFVALVQTKLRKRFRQTRNASERWNPASFSDPTTNPVELAAEAYAWSILRQYRMQRRRESLGRREEAKPYCEAQLSELVTVLSNGQSQRAATGTWTTPHPKMLVACDSALLRDVRGAGKSQRDLLHGLIDLAGYAALVRRRIERGVNELKSAGDDPEASLTAVLTNRSTFGSVGAEEVTVGLTLRRALRAESAATYGSLRRDLLEACRSAFPDVASEDLWKRFVPPNYAVGDLVWQELLLLNADWKQETFEQVNRRKRAEEAVVAGDHHAFANCVLQAAAENSFSDEVAAVIRRTFQPAPFGISATGSSQVVEHQVGDATIEAMAAEKLPEHVLLKPSSGVVYRLLSCESLNQESAPKEGFDLSQLIVVEVGEARLSYKKGESILSIRASRHKRTFSGHDLAEQLDSGEFVVLPVPGAYGRGGAPVDSAHHPMVKQWLTDNPVGRQLYESEAIHACVKGRTLSSESEYGLGVSR